MKKNVLILFFVFLFLGTAYWFKCQNEIDLVKCVSLKNIPPFSLLQNPNPYNIVYAQETKTELLTDTFTSKLTQENWDKLWMREEGAVTIGNDLKGYDDSPSLIITSRSAKDWSLGYKKMIEVSPGEVYSFSGWVKTSGREAAGTLSVVLYDADKKVLQWQYAKESVAGADNWRRVEREFIISDGVKYIRFRLTGWKEGKVWFDKIKFNKEGKTVQFDQNTWLLDNPYLTMTLDAGKGRWTVMDKRSSKVWEAWPGTAEFLVTKVTKDALQLWIEMVSLQTMDSFTAVAALLPDQPEIVFLLIKRRARNLPGLSFRRFLKSQRAI